MNIELTEEERRYLALLVKNRHNEMCDAIDMKNVIEEAHDQEFQFTERLLEKLDPEDTAVYTEDYPFLKPARIAR